MWVVCWHVRRPLADRPLSFCTTPFFLLYGTIGEGALCFLYGPALMVLQAALSTCAVHHHAQVDRLFDWRSEKDAPIRDALDRQPPHVAAEFERRLGASILNLNEQGLNVALYWKNPDPRRYVNIVPTSAISGEGVPDMLQLLVKLTQARAYTAPMHALSPAPWALGTVHNLCSSAYPADEGMQRCVVQPAMAQPSFPAVLETAVAA